MTTTLKVLLTLAVVAVAAAGGLFGAEYLASSRDPQAQGVAGGQAVRVGVAALESRTIEDAVTSVGTMRPVRSIELVPTEAGRVTEVPVTSGQEVEAGDVIVQLDDRAALAEAEAVLSAAEQEFRRVEELAESNTAAEAQLEDARAAYRQAQAGVDSAREALDDRLVTASFAGTLGLIDTEPGAYLDASTPITRLSDLTAVEVAFSVPERYFRRVEPRQTVYVTTPAYGETEFEGSVTVRAPEIDLASRSFDIRARIDNPDGQLVGGMFADARLVLGTYEGHAVPDDAIISEGLTSYVFTVVDGTARRTEVETGASIGSLTEVRGELSADAQVVVAGWDDLADGDAVEIVEDVAGEGLQ